ncbi:hypothetical protein ABFS82_10G169000 [Erythranthe guttata]|uniref:Uncharacterized protein n=1 Tax=Erythranthe guttata TaxID=4155 RepID=A0A022RHM3_ERYGU|nr:PREDICTED: cytochrome P450 93A3-like [Erythranthe guttata]EYU39902.1 hypothetical protein MIMGU_mgv1a023279mg [Erythranthe guttata]|eukprot:XP_012834369.1 PREDICTED: cytochrome P450 93A3-like [Erythranthe guttata]
MAEYIIFFLIWLISTIIIRTLIKQRSSTSRSLPPTPRGLPIIGHLHLLSPIPHQALAKLSSKHGPLIHIRLGSYPCLIVSSPEISKEILKTHESSCSNRPQNAAIDYLTYGSQDFTFAPYGPYWKFMKKLCMSRLLGGPTLDLLRPVRAHEINRLVQFVASKAGNGESVDIGGEFVRTTNNVISSMIMSQRCSGDGEGGAEAVRKLVQDIAELTGRFNVSDYIWFCKNLDLQGFGKRMKDVRDMFDEMTERIIDEHLVRRREYSQESVKDLLHILLDIAEDSASEFKLTRQNIKAFILDLFTAGTDTSAITLQWALSELINHPEIMQKAAQEIDSLIGNNERLVQESDITNLPYLQAIVKETLRLHPTAPLIGRQSSEDCTIAGYCIPAETRLFVNVWAIGRNPDYWENALEFIPERFISSELDLRGQHYHFLPFGSGRRGCPGISLALQVVQTTLAAMIQCFEWKADGVSTRVDMEEGIGMTLPRANPLVCSPVLRLNSIPSNIFF